jgi:hypothetical protein
MEVTVSRILMAAPTMGKLSVAAAWLQSLSCAVIPPLIMNSIEKKGFIKVRIFDG